MDARELEGSPGRADQPHAPVNNLITFDSHGSDGAGAVPSCVCGLEVDSNERPINVTDGILPLTGTSPRR
jgi:hypothetical protein